MHVHPVCHLQESFLEDINNILNSGEVPNLLGNDDMEAIGAAMRPLMMTAGLPVTKQGIYAYFVNRVRSYLHLVLCFSPIGDAFRQRLRMFPSLVNCCTIDWFRWAECLVGMSCGVDGWLVHLIAVMHVFYGLCFCGS
jgi:dynein heavy chain